MSWVKGVVKMLAVNWQASIIQSLRAPFAHSTLSESRLVPNTRVEKISHYVSSCGLDFRDGTFH